MSRTRMDISLNTGNSEDKNAQDNYFDQITAMSQGIINASFKELFDRVKQQRVPQIVYNGALGNLDGVLNAPYIMINGTSDNASEIFYVLRIESGVLMFEDGQKREMHDWEIAVRTKLSDTTYDELPGDSARVKKRKEKWRSDIANKYPGFRAGEYSVQRVFCAIGSAEWENYNEDLSTVWDPVTKQRISFSTWLGRAANSIYTEHILSLLKGWAREQEGTETSTMGIKFSLNSASIDQVAPTFRPVHVYNQTYPYMVPGPKVPGTEDPAPDIGVVGYGDYDKRDEEHPYGQLEPGDYNCLLYCENVDRVNGQGREKKVGARPLPVNKRMGFGGNLAQPGPPLIPGSFVMDHRVFMTTFLLPQMQELCLATYMQIAAPHQYYDAATGRNMISSKYAIGCQLEGDTPKSADDDFFKLKLDRVVGQNANLDRVVGQNANLDQPSFLWRRFSEQDGRSADKVHKYTFDGFPDAVTGYGSYWIRAESEVKVDWISGTPTLNVSGTMKYDYQISFSDFKDMRDPRELKYIVTATWSFTIVMRNVTVPIKNEKGERIGEAKVLRPCIEGLTDGRPTNTKVVSNETEHDDNITGDTVKEIEKRLNITLPEGMTRIIANVSKRFDHAGKLSYPGHGELEFQDPMFTRLGNLIATVKYKKPSIGDEKMYFPNIDPKALALKPPSLPPAETSSFRANLQDHRSPRLDWYHHLKYNEKTRVGRLILRGTNRKSGGEGNELLLAFSSIRISLIHTPTKDEATGEVLSNKLFSEAPFEIEARPGLMEEFYSSGKALFVKIIKILKPSSDDEDGEAKSIQDAPFVSSNDIKVQDDTSAKTTSEATPDLQVKTAPVAVPLDSTDAPVAPLDSKDTSVAPVDSTNTSVAPSDSTAAPTDTNVSNKQAKGPTPPVATSQSSSAKTPSQKKPKMQEVDKKVETWKPSANTYSFKAWDQDEEIEEKFDRSTTQVKPTINVDKTSRAIVIVLRPTFGEVADVTERAARGFVVPHNQGFELQLQGDIEHLGQYAIKIQEEWCKVDLVAEELTTEANAVDYKMIDLKLVETKPGVQKVVVDEYDLSDRMAEEKKKRDEAEKAILEAAEAAKKAALSQEY